MEDCKAGRERPGGADRSQNGPQSSSYARQTRVARISIPSDFPEDMTVHRNGGAAAPSLPQLSVSKAAAARP